MNWEEITQKYDKEKDARRLLDKTRKVDKGWGNLMRSTDKLVWLFLFSDAAKPKPSKTA